MMLILIYWIFRWREILWGKNSAKWCHSQIYTKLSYWWLFIGVDYLTELSDVEYLFINLLAICMSSWMAIIKKLKDILARMWRNWNFCWLLVECKLVQSLWKMVWSFLKRLKIELPYDPITLLLNIYSKELKTHF